MVKLSKYNERERGMSMCRNVVKYEEGGEFR